MAQGMLIFNSVQAAIQAGFEMQSFYPDSEGMFKAEKTIDTGGRKQRAQALVRSMQVAQ